MCGAFFGLCAGLLVGLVIVATMGSGYVNAIERQDAEHKHSMMSARVRGGLGRGAA